jgi:hypothetical protein
MCFVYNGNTISNMYKPNKHMEGFFHSLDHGKGQSVKIPGSGSNHKATLWLDGRDRSTSWIYPQSSGSQTVPKPMKLSVNEFSDYFDVQECQSSACIDNLIVLTYRKNILFAFGRQQRCWRNRRH